MARTPPIPEPLWKTASPEVQAAVLALVEFYEQCTAQLEARINDLENRLKLNSTNSSKPPSSDPIGMQRKPPAPSSGRKRGGQPGHRKANRNLVPPEKIRQTTHCKLTACRRCGHGISGEDPEPLIHQVAELPEIEPIVNEYRLHRLTCPGYSETTCGILPRVSQPGASALASKPCWPCSRGPIVSPSDRSSSWYETCLRFRFPQGWSPNWSGSRPSPLKPLVTKSRLRSMGPRWQISTKRRGAKIAIRLGCGPR